MTDVYEIERNWVSWWWRDEMWHTGRYDSKFHRVARLPVYKPAYVPGLTACGRVIGGSSSKGTAYTDRVDGRNPALVCRSCTRFDRAVPPGTERTPRSG